MNKELKKIFVSPKENELMNAIDKILKKLEPEPLTMVQKDQLNSISKEIDKLFEDDELTSDEEKKLTTFQASIDKLFENHKPEVLSDADQKELDKLHESLDKLSGVKQPSKEEITRAEEISTEPDKIYAKYIENPTIESILGKDQKEIETLFEDGVISAEKESTLTKLDKQMEELYGKPKELNDADNKKLGEHFSELDRIYEKQTPREIDNEKLTKLSQELEGLLEQIFPEKDGAEIKNLMNELQSFGRPLDVIDGDDAVPFGKFGANSFLISELGNLRIEDFNPGEGDVLMFNKEN